VKKLNILLNRLYIKIPMTLGSLVVGAFILLIYALGSIFAGIKESGHLWALSVMLFGMISMWIPRLKRQIAIWYLLIFLSILISYGVEKYASYRSGQDDILIDRLIEEDLENFKGTMDSGFEQLYQDWDKRDADLKAAIGVSMNNVDTNVKLLVESINILIGHEALSAEQRDKFIEHMKGIKGLTKENRDYLEHL